MKVKSSKKTSHDGRHAGPNISRLTRSNGIEPVFMVKTVVESICQRVCVGVTSMIHWCQPGVRATADEHGIVYLPSMAAGLTQIVASYPGFSPSLEKATLKAGENVETVKLRLAPVVEKVTVRPTSSSSDRSS